MAVDLSDPIQRADALRGEADYLLEETGLARILAEYGPVCATGSYFLNVMVYPDLDLLVEGVPIQALFQAGGRLAAHPLVWQIVFEKSTLEDLPGGLYLKARLNFGGWGRAWKIDIWSLDKATIARKMGEMEHFKDRLTPARRTQILRYKLSVLTPEKRTPTYSGYFIYKAILDEGLDDPAEISRYLNKNGIKLE